MAFLQINKVSTLLKLPSFLTGNFFVNYGYQKDTPSPKDLSFSTSPLNTNTNVNEISIKQYFKDISNQYNVGSCVANATCDACESQVVLKNNINPSQVPDLSRLFVYYNARNLDTPPSVNTDGGSKIRFAFDSIRRYGVCKETTWTYDTNKVNTQPSFLAYKESLQNKITAFYRIDTCGDEKFQQIKNALAQNHPIVFGISITDSFRRVNSDAVIRIPSNASDPYIGSHALCITGWSASREAFEVRNSWSDSWGNKGYCYMHKDYIVGLSNDLWVPSI